VNRCCEQTKKHRPCPIGADRQCGGKWYCHVHDPNGTFQHQQLGARWIKAHENKKSGFFDFSRAPEEMELDRGFTAALRKDGVATQAAQVCYSFDDPRIFRHNQLAERETTCSPVSSP